MLRVGVGRTRPRGCLVLVAWRGARLTFVPNPCARAWSLAGSSEAKRSCEPSQGNFLGKGGGGENEFQVGKE